MLTAALLSALILSGCGFGVERGTFTDSRDGQKYETVKIGRITWMAENLNFETDKSWCYDDNNSNCAKFGRLYTWNAATTACPSGWRLPNANHWDHLLEVAGRSYVAGEYDAGEGLKSRKGWDGTNKFSFSALPGGNRVGNGKFTHIGSVGIWWTSTGAKMEENFAEYRAMKTDVDRIFEDDGHKSLGLSVRCIRSE